MVKGEREKKNSLPKPDLALVIDAETKQRKYRKDHEEEKEEAEQRVEKMLIGKNIKARVQQAWQTQGSKQIQPWNEYKD